MKKFMFLCLFSAFSLLLQAAEFGIDAYYRGNVGPDCEEWFLVMYLIDDEGRRTYQGSATVQIGEGCDPGSNGIFIMDPGSLVDFNNLEDNVGAKQAIVNWLSSHNQMSKTSIELGSPKSFIYKNKSGNYILHLVGDVSTGTANLLIHNSAGQQVIKINRLESTAKVNEMLILELNELPKGIYFAIFSESIATNQQISNVRFVID